MHHIIIEPNNLSIFFASKNFNFNVKSILCTFKANHFFHIYPHPTMVSFPKNHANTKFLSADCFLWYAISKVGKLKLVIFQLKFGLPWISGPQDLPRGRTPICLYLLSSYQDLFSLWPQILTNMTIVPHPSAITQKIAAWNTSFPGKLVFKYLFKYCKIF